jgi:hypothetical protein
MKKNIESFCVILFLFVISLFGTYYVSWLSNSGEVQNPNLIHVYWVWMIATMILGVAATFFGASIISSWYAMNQEGDHVSYSSVGFSEVIFRPAYGLRITNFSTVITGYERLTFYFTVQDLWTGKSFDVSFEIDTDSCNVLQATGFIDVLGQQLTKNRKVIVMKSDNGLLTLWI